MKTDRIIDHIVQWLLSYCDQSGLNGFVVGVSGGIDSAVTSTLCARTGKPVYALCMPINQHPEQVSLAQKHSRWLETQYGNVKAVTVELSDTLSSIAKALPADIQDGLTMANTRSRLRMVTLYAFAAHHRMLVAGTGNKVEDFGIGFFTKYGDGGVDISPLADLLKTEVYELGIRMGIDHEIIAAPPTDGLWADSRTDESQIGATYSELEWAMGFDADQLDEDQLNRRQQEVLAIYRKFNQVNRHKMVPIPVCKIPKALK